MSNHQSFVIFSSDVITDSILIRAASTVVGSWTKVKNNSTSVIGVHSRFMFRHSLRNSLHIVHVPAVLVEMRVGGRP